MRVPGPGMPPHKYVMISEPFNFFINDGKAARKSWRNLANGTIGIHHCNAEMFEMIVLPADPEGNLTAGGAGWKLAPGQTAPKAAGGGVSMQWAPDPASPETKPVRPNARSRPPVQNSCLERGLAKRGRRHSLTLSGWKTTFGSGNT